MHNIYFSQTLVVLALSLTTFLRAGAHSVRQGPLRTIEHPSTLVLEILPRVPTRHVLGTFDPISAKNPVLLPSDTIHLSLSAFSQTFHLHLHPNLDIIHPDAQIHYHRLSKDGFSSILHRSESLLRDSVMSFQGDVVHPDHSFQRLRENAAGGLDRNHKEPSGSLGWARIIIHHQGDVRKNIAPIFEGAFVVNGVTHHVVTLENYFRNRHELDPVPPETTGIDQQLVIFRDSDALGIDDAYSKYSSVQSCSHDSLPFNRDMENHPVLRVGAGLDRSKTRFPWLDNIWSPSDMDLGFDIVKRGDMSGNITSNFVGDIGSSNGCPKSQKILYMGVAADCSYVAHYGGVANATTQILNNWNVASSLFKSTFNISLGIVELNIQEATCPSTPDPNVPWNVGCDASTTLDDRLSLFSDWRGKKNDSDGAGLWHLMTACPTGAEIGVAWLGTLCQTKSSGSGSSIVSGTAVTTATRTEWGVVAHEIGHNFGAIHDCTSNCTLSDSCCPSSSSSCDSSSNFLMSPVSESKQKVFSSCTFGNVCTAMQSMNTTCLQDASSSRTVLSLQMCGNGVVEDGEDCDPGTGGNSTCCNPATCKFTSNSVCDPSNDECCTDKCQPAPSTQVCRPSLDAACDQQEMCDGKNTVCPVDHTSPNGKSCGQGLACANGRCTSRDQQCSTVGLSMNLTKACPTKNDRSCSVSCEDPHNPNQCIVLQSILVDGSPCGYGGSCSHGDCIPGSFLAKAKAWFVSNLQLSVPTAIVVSLLGIFIMWSIFLAAVRWCCCGRRHANRMKPPPPAISRHGQRLGSDDSLDHSQRVPKVGFASVNDSPNGVLNMQEVPPAPLRLPPL